MLARERSSCTGPSRERGASVRTAPKLLDLLQRQPGLELRASNALQRNVYDQTYLVPGVVFLHPRTLLEWQVRLSGWTYRGKIHALRFLSMLDRQRARGRMVIDPSFAQ